MEILDLFGIDLQLFLAQLVNFGIVVFVLWRFALKPMSKTLKERNAEISKGLDDAKKAEERLDKVEKEVKEKLQETKAEAMDILEVAKKNAEKNKQASLDKTKAEVEALIVRAKEQIASEKEAMVSEVKAEVSEMVVTALGKILSEKVSKDIDKKYIDSVLQK